MQYRYRYLLRIFIVVFLCTLVLTSVKGQEGQTKAGAEPQTFVTTQKPPVWFPRNDAEANLLSRGVVPPAILRAGEYMWIEVGTTADTVDISPGNGVCADSFGLCSLRAAVMEGNARPGFEGIYVPAGIYVLTLAGADDEISVVGDLDITSSEGMEIYGAYYGSTIISGNGVTGLFDIKSGANIYLSSLTLTNAKTSNNGAAVKNVGSAYLWNMTLNSNSSTTYGGAIANRGYMTVNRSTISGNSATLGGGAIDNWNYDPANVEVELYLYNVTISGNSSESGAGIYADYGAEAWVNNATIVNNTASLNSGGIYGSTEGYITLNNTIVASNSAPGSPDCSGEVYSRGYNILRNNTGCTFFDASGDRIGTALFPIDPMLGTLTDNGGKIYTHALHLNSPARDAGDNYTCLNSDARGVYRSQDSNYNGFKTCDIGAYEHAAPFTLFFPYPGGTIYHPYPDFNWTGDQSAVRYEFQLRGVGIAYQFKKTINASSYCMGVVCSYYPTLPLFPAKGDFEWRVTSIDNFGVRKNSMWHSFSAEIPAKPYMYSPQDFTQLTDTTPVLSWGNDYVSGYRLIIKDAETNVILRKTSITYSSVLSMNTVCPPNYLCSVSTDQLGLNLSANRTYKWRVMALSTASWYTPQLVKKNYKSKSKWFTFTITNNPTVLDNDSLLPLPPTP